LTGVLDLLADRLSAAFAAFLAFFLRSCRRFISSTTDLTIAACSSESDSDSDEEVADSMVMGGWSIVVRTGRSG